MRCDHCVERADYLELVVQRLTLPVRLAGGGSSYVEVLEQPFVHQAYVRQGHEAGGEVRGRAPAGPLAWRDCHCTAPARLLRGEVATCLP